MSYVSPVIEGQFNTLAPELKSYILEMDVQLYTLQDLMRVLQEIVNESEGETSNALDNASK